MYVPGQTPFVLVSAMDGRAVKGKSDTDSFVEMWSLDFNDESQQWVQVLGNQYINLQSLLPLYAGTGRAWTYDDEMKRVVDVVNPGKALDRGWAQWDGAFVHTYDLHLLGPEQFMKLPLSITEFVNGKYVNFWTGNQFQGILLNLKKLFIAQIFHKSKFSVNWQVA